MYVNQILIIKGLCLFFLLVTNAEVEGPFAQGLGVLRSTKK